MTELELACCPGYSWVAGQLIVGFLPGTTLAGAQLIAGRAGATVIERISPSSWAYLMAVPAGQELAYIPRFVNHGALYAEVNAIGCIYHNLKCCCCPDSLICPALPACSTIPADPRGSGFWKHQCGESGFQQVTQAELNVAFTMIDQSSYVFAYGYAGPGCAGLTAPPRSDMNGRVEKELQALWLNVATCQVSTETSVDLPHLSPASTVGEALWEIERTLIDPVSSTADLARAKDLAEAINTTGDDLDLVVPEGDVAATAGSLVSFVVGVVNVGELPLSIDVVATSEWLVGLSSTHVSDLEGGEGVPLITQVEVPTWAVPGERFEVQITALSAAGPLLRRDAVARLLVVDERAGRTSPRVQEEYQGGQ